MRPPGFAGPYLSKRILVIFYIQYAIYTIFYTIPYLLSFYKSLFYKKKAARGNITQIVKFLTIYTPNYSLLYMVSSSIEYKINCD